MKLWSGVLALTAIAIPIAGGQGLEYRGFLETSARIFPYVRTQDSGRVIGDALFRLEAGYRPRTWLLVEAGLDARADTHRQVDRSPGLTWWDRGFERPALAVRRMNFTLRGGRFTAQFGKQVIRWGAAGILNPTDRFAPRDYLSVVESEVLPVTAARASYETVDMRIEFVAAPRMTPSRSPLARQRWAPLPVDYPPNAEILQPEPPYPNRAQWGVHLSRAWGKLDYSFNFFDGNDHAPLGDQALISVQPWVALITRRYPRIRMYGGDLVYTARYVTLRAESAYFASKPEAPGVGRGDDYALYVIEAERQSGKVQWTVAYANKALLEDRKSYSFDPQRSLAGCFLGRLHWGWRSNYTLGIEGAVRQSGGAWLSRAVLTRSWGPHLTTKFNITWIYGAAGDFLGQFRRNSYGSFTDRYSF